MDFNFLDKSQPYSATMTVARALRWHPVANVLNYRYAMADFDKGGWVLSVRWGCLALMTKV